MVQTIRLKRDCDVPVTIYLLRLIDALQKWPLFTIYQNSQGNTRIAVSILIKL